jgi:cytoskeletal protein CcmA (bactofilin family)
MNDEERARRFVSRFAAAASNVTARRASMNTVAHIGRSIHIKGEVTAKEPLTIAGSVSGTIDLSGFALTVTEEAKLDADIMAHTIVVAGTVSGRMIADGRIVLQHTATVTGDVEAPALTVHEGAVVQGRLDIAGNRSKGHQAQPAQQAQQVQQSQQGQLVALKPAV